MDGNAFQLCEHLLESRESNNSTILTKAVDQSKTPLSFSCKRRDSGIEVLDEMDTSKAKGLSESKSGIKEDQGMNNQHSSPDTFIESVDNECTLRVPNCKYKGETPTQRSYPDKITIGLS